MILSVKVTQYRTVKTKETGFPIFRMKTIDEDESIYWKFHSRREVTRIHLKMVETAIMHLKDPNADFVTDIIDSIDMAIGTGEYDIISEAMFDVVHNQLIQMVAES